MNGLNVYTGRSKTLEDALVEAVRTAGASNRLVIVPRQLTLQTEQTLLNKLRISGAFDLQVMSTERLCARIFEAAGTPEGERVDDRGRVMLARRAIRAARDRLTIYRDSEKLRGFAENATEQLERIRQAHMDPDALRVWAEEMGGTASLKLRDLASILEEYETLIEGRYLDGQSEFGAAIRRVEQARFLRDTTILFYGYDLVPPTLYELIAAISVHAGASGLFMPLVNDPDAPDHDCYLPMAKAYARLEQMVYAAGGTIHRIPVFEADTADRSPDLRLLERSLFAWPAESAQRPSDDIILLEPRTVREECMYAAALTRSLVRARGWRWNDVQLVVSDPNAYAEPLRAAFADCDIPIVLSSSRSAARLPIVECLTTALHALTRSFPPKEMQALLATGFMPVSPDEAERYANFIVRTGLRGTMFLRPLRRGQEAERAYMEPIRAKVAKPLLKLQASLRAAGSLSAQVAALFAFLENIDALETLDKQIEQLIQLGERERANEVGQVWNRLLGAMDQMVALMGEEKLSPEELSATLGDSLSASVIKALPQSGDAVYAQGMTAACSRPAKALLILGLSDQPGGREPGLLTQEQTRALSRISGRYLGPDDSDLSYMRRFYLKAALGMATDLAVVSCPMSAIDGTVQRKSMIFDRIRDIFPGQEISDGYTQTGADRLLRNAVRPALQLSAQTLANRSPLSATDYAALAALSRLSLRDDHVRRSLDSMRLALDRTMTNEHMHPATALELYHNMHRQSVTSLEQFAQCPFAYYVKYGLRPEKIEPYAYRANDEGTFMHEAVRQFMLESRQDLRLLNASQAESRMAEIAQRLLDQQEQTSALGDTSVTRAERRRLLATAKACAVSLAAQMHNSSFENKALECPFGSEDGDAALRLEDGIVLQGTIDRIDAWTSDFDGGGMRDYLRVIDYKRGGKPLKLAEAYYGLSFQLPVYLAAAMRQQRGGSAGVYYFPLIEGICDTQSNNPAQVERERDKLFQMTGLMPEPKALRDAISPKLDEVLRVRVSEKTGEPYSGTLMASKSDYENIVRHVLRQAQQRTREIRSGLCAVAPAKLDRRSACEWCNYRKVCLFDPILDAPRVRKMVGMPEEEALSEIILASHEAEGESSQPAGQN